MPGTAPFARAGRPTVVAIQAGASDRPWTGADVLAVETASRAVDAGTAARRVATAVRSIQAPEGTILFKKIDSTLRGNLVAELAPVLAAGGAEARTVSTAAVLSCGRLPAVSMLMLEMSDDPAGTEAAAAIRDVARLTGIFAEPAAAAPFAGGVPTSDRPRKTPATAATTDTSIC